MMRGLDRMNTEDLSKYHFICERIGDEVNIFFTQECGTHNLKGWRGKTFIRFKQYSDVQSESSDLQYLSLLQETAEISDPHINFLLTVSGKLCFILEFSSTIRNILGFSFL